MSTDTIANELRLHVMREAYRQLKHAYSEEQAREAAGRVALAFMAARASATKPGDWDYAAQNNPEAFMAAVATSCATELYPGGANPTCYLVPQDGKINWRITHRGVAKLANREGFTILPVPVHKEDELRVELGEVVSHRFVDDPMSMDELAGVAVVVRRLGDSTPAAKVWVSTKRILARAKKSPMFRKGRGPWKDWPIEMAQKTAVLYVASRGTMPIDSPEWSQAIDADNAGNLIDVQPEAPATVPRPAVAAPADALALPAPGLMDEEPPFAGTGEQRTLVEVPAEN